MGGFAFPFRISRPLCSGVKILSVLLLLLPFSNGQYYLESKTCSVLHSGSNFDGEGLTFGDGVESTLLAEDQRLSDEGWNLTGSITVESGCILDACNETYFDGTCRSFEHGKHTDLSSDIFSAKCNCFKECKCSDIFMKKTSCARGYLKGGCKTCNAYYTDLVGEEEYLPDDFVGKVEALRLRKGCKLTLFSEVEFEGEDKVVEDEIVEDFNFEFGSYRCECDDSKFEKRVKPPRPENYPPLIDIPEKLDEVIKMMKNKTYSNHPGLRTAYMSMKSGRSPKNAYILLVGSSGAGKSSAINLLFDNPDVTKVGVGSSTTTDIHEFRIRVPIDDIGVANSELRVIDTPGLGDTRGLHQDATFLATLEAYLANHEELKDRIPNVVLIFHKFHDNRYNGDGSAYVKMLRGLDSFREKITDENFSNVIFVFSHFCSETKQTQRRPDVRLANFREVIENYSLFPKPIVVTVAENRAKEQDLPMVNGFYKLPNNEYYPRNLFEKLELVTKKGNDMMGLGVFRSAFRDSDDFDVQSTDFRLQKGSSRIEYYLGILTNAYFSIEKTEISQLLKQTWEEKLDDSLKKRFPGSLPYLQKALSLRNVNTKDDVPKTTNGILKLLTAIKHDAASRELLKEALGVQAPLFPQNTIAGYSYNVFKDMYLPASPFKLGDVDGSDIGFLIPKILTCKLEPLEKESFYVIPNKMEYMQFRLQSLGIGGTLDNNSFTGTTKPGHNIQVISFREDGSSLTALREFRLFDLVLNDKMDLAPEFEKAVKSLPVFNEDDHETVDKWNKFFTEYGTHIVKTAHGGGSIEIRLESNKKYDEKLAKLLFDLVKFAEDLAPVAEIEEEGEASLNGTTEAPSVTATNTTEPEEINTVLPEDSATHTLIFTGGDPAYHTSDLTRMSVEEASKLLANWKKSLKYNPAILANEMQLVPISQIVKHLGQNYSTEIDRATSLLFNSELKYSKKKPIQAGPGAREDTQFMHEMLKMQAESNKRFTDVMLEMKTMMQNQEQQRREMERQRAEWERKQIETGREYQKEQQQRDELHKLEMQRQQQLADQRFMELMQQISNRPTQAPTVIHHHPPKPKCLKEGTKILMADMSEKSVEKLKLGDFIMDNELKPTRVLGVDSEFLMGGKLYGFEDNSFFFTGGHIFVGPSKNNEMKLYAQSLKEVYLLNPLMEYMNMSEMDASGETAIFHLKQAEVSTRTVGVFEDPTSYPPETRVYFVIVDNPTGTYFANGYVCRHDIPPFELWPNTMGLFFRLAGTDAIKQFAEVPYELDTIPFVEQVMEQVTQTVKSYMAQLDSRDWGTVKQTQFPVMNLSDIDVEESISSIFSHPTVGLASNTIYAMVGRIISPYLDSTSYGKPDRLGDRLGQVQHELLNIMNDELHKQLKM